MQAETIELTQRENIEIRRKRLGITQQDLAKKAQLHPTYGARVLQGGVKSKAALDTMEMAVDALEIEARIAKKARRKKEAA